MGFEHQEMLNTSIHKNWIHLCHRKRSKVGQVGKVRPEKCLPDELRTNSFWALTTHSYFVHKWLQNWSICGPNWNVLHRVAQGTTHSIFARKWCKFRGNCRQKRNVLTQPKNSSSGVRPEFVREGIFRTNSVDSAKFGTCWTNLFHFAFLKQELHKCRPASPKAFKVSFAIVNAKNCTQHAEFNETMIRFNTSTMKHNKTGNITVGYLSARTDAEWFLSSQSRSCHGPRRQAPQI